MALSIEQIAAVSYPAVLAEMRKAQNQWHESAAMRELEKQGCVERINFGENIEVPLDYRRNPDAAVMASDQDTATLLKTEVVTSAVYDIAQLSVPVTMTKGDDAKNPTETQKISLVKQLLENAINSHDSLIEAAIFTTTTEGGVELNGLADLVKTDGLGTVGGISASTETFWRNAVETYTDGTDIEAGMTQLYNEVARGTGSTLATKFLISGITPHSQYEGGLQTLQRFVDTSEADAGFKVLAFKNARYVFSDQGSTSVYFLNPKAYKLVTSKQYFRDKGETTPVPGQNASYFLIYSALQFVVSNRSRLGVLYVG
jgi:hypothetical protein